MPKVNEKVIGITVAALLAAAGLVGFLVWMFSSQDKRQVNRAVVVNTDTGNGPFGKEGKNSFSKFKNRDDYEMELTRLLGKDDEKKLEDFYAAMKEKYNLAESLLDLVKRRYEEKKQDTLAPGHIVSNWDYTFFMRIEFHMRRLDPDYEAENFISFLENHYGVPFIEAFTKLEANPEAPEASELAKTAESTFYSASLLCKSEVEGSPYYHEALKSGTTCVGYLNTKIMGLLEKNSPEAMKYIKILRNFKPDAELAFPGKSSLDDINQIYAAEGKSKFTVPDGSFLIHNKQIIEDVLNLGLRELKALAKRTIINSNPKDIYISEANQEFLKLSCVVKENENDFFMAWARTGFKIHNCDEFEACMSSRPSGLISALIQFLSRCSEFTSRHYKKTQEEWPSDNFQLDVALGQFLHYGDRVADNGPDSAIVIKACRVHDRSSLDESIRSISQVPFLVLSFCDYFKEIGTSKKKLSPKVQLYREMYAALCE